MRRRGISSSEIEAALQEANRHRCSPPLDPREVEGIARSVGRYEPAENLVRPVELAPSSGPQRADPTMLLDALPDSGFLREYVDWVRPCTDAPAHFHVVAGLVCMSAALGNRCFVDTGAGLFPNLYAVLVAPSTRSRKSTVVGFARRLLDHLMAEAQLGRDAVEQQPVVLPSDFSLEALFQTLSQRPTGVMIWSELGAALSKFGRSYMQGTAELFTDLYDCPQRAVRVLRRERFVIERPCMSVFAGTTPEWLTEHVTETTAVAGFLPRSVFVGTEEPGELLELPPPLDHQEELRLAAALNQIRQSYQPRRTYVGQARLFLDWLNQQGLALEHLTSTTIADWRRSLERQSLKPATRALKLIAVRKFLLWAADEGRTPLLADTDLETRTRNGQKTPLAPPKVHAEPVRYLDFDELRALLESPASSRRRDGSPRANSLRDTVVLSLLALRGLREGELADLKIGGFRARQGGAVLHVTGKGRKQRRLDLDENLWSLVKAYVQETGRSMSPSHKGKPFLLGQRGPMTAQGVIDVVRRHGRRALDRDDVTPHMLRRTFATLASREIRDERGNVVKPAMPPYVLQRMLGHEDLKTTQRYVNAAAEADGVGVDTYLGVAAPCIPQIRQQADEEEGL